MKAIQRFCRFFVRSSAHASLLYTLAIILLACSSSNDDDPQPTPPPVDNVPPTVCKVTSVTGNSAGKYDATKNYTLSYKLTYSYDQKGNLVNNANTYNYKFSDGTTSTSAYSANNQFNDDGFIIRTLWTSNSNSNGTVSNYTRNTEYQYDNNRLIKEVNATVENGKAKDYIITYEYDTESRLTKVNHGYDNSYTKYEWSGNKLQKMTTVDAYGKSESPFLEFNQDGLLTKSIETYGSSTDEMRYTYDAKGNNIRTERHINSKPSSAWTNEFDGKKNPSTPTYANFKGHPILIRVQPEYAPKENVTKSSYYQANTVSGAWELTNYSINTFDYNAKDFPVDQITKNFDNKAGTETSSRRESYEYQDCN